MYFGIRPYSQYPGNEQFDVLYDTLKKIDSNLELYRHTTDRQKQNLWRAMTGTYLSLPGAALLMDKNKEESQEEYASGGKIHIKKENRGKLTALMKRTGHSASWFKKNGTKAQQKMATFAINAAKWKHGDGGLLDRMQSVYGNDIVAMRKALQMAKNKQ